MKTELVTVTSLFMAFAAQCAFAAEQGFSGSIGAVAIYSETQSNLNVGAEKILTSLNREGEIVTGSTLAPIGQLRYQFGQHQLFLGQSEDTFVKGLLALELGYQYSSIHWMKTLHSPLPSRPPWPREKRGKTRTSLIANGRKPMLKGMC